MALEADARAETVNKVGVSIRSDLRKGVGMRSPRKVCLVRVS